MNYMVVWTSRSYTLTFTALLLLLLLFLYSTPAKLLVSLCTALMTGKYDFLELSAHD